MNAWNGEEFAMWIKKNIKNKQHIILQIEQVRGKENGTKICCVKTLAPVKFE